MKGRDWGGLQRACKDAVRLDHGEIEVEIGALILDDEVEKKAGIYPYSLTRDDRHLNLRAFKAGVKHKVYLEQNGKCAICGEPFEIDGMEADRVTPWSTGGKTTEDNCQMLCKPCNRKKSSK